MFTGLIESVGTVKSLRKTGGSARLAVELGSIAAELGLGDSVAVNGVCLTVVSTGSSEAAFDVVRETLDRSALGALKSGDRVNIERALKVGGRIGGHFVQGHVDGIGRVSQINRSGGFVEIKVSAGPEVMELIVQKGSIAIDGISLTVARRDPDRFMVAVIPHTLENTNLGSVRVGSAVNLETDILGKYVWSLLNRDQRGQQASDATGVEQALRNAGYM